MVPLHPQALDGDPAALLWVVPAKALPFTGSVAAVPAPLAALLDDGALAEVRLTAQGVVTRLGSGRSWSRAGPQVRTALHAALEHRDGWIAADQTGADRTGADQSGADQSGADPVVRIRIAGACRGCPAAALSPSCRREVDASERPGFRALEPIVEDGVDGLPWWRRPLVLSRAGRGFSGGCGRPDA